MNNNFSDLTKRGIEFYERELKAVLEPDHNGKFVAIEPDSETYFVHENRTQVALEARASLPDKLFYFTRVGQKHSASVSNYVSTKRRD